MREFHSLELLRIVFVEAVLLMVVFGAVLIIEIITRHLIVYALRLKEIELQFYDKGFQCSMAFPLGDRQSFSLSGNSFLVWRLGAADIGHYGAHWLGLVVAAGSAKILVASSPASQYQRHGGGPEIRGQSF